ncbi:LexA family protein [Candidatus Caldatribacterium saccharofermentans]|uniref:LexA family protein n=1 Tax=Candidatus Caldatribacterium saccharofermentans TaxID=1454753 RepID=UPI003D02E4FF
MHHLLLEDLQVFQIIDASGANLFTRSIWKRKLWENARRYGVTLYADWSGKMRRDFGPHPKLSNILVVDAEIPPTRFPRHSYFLRAEGNSMVEAGITLGSFVLFSPNLEVQSGDIAVVEVGEVFQEADNNLRQGRFRVFRDMRDCKPDE